MASSKLGREVAKAVYQQCRLRVASRTVALLPGALSATTSSGRCRTRLGLWSVEGGRKFILARMR